MDQHEAPIGLPGSHGRRGVVVPTDEVYLWQGALPSHAIVHGRGYVTAAFSHDFSLRRGLDASLSFDLVGKLEGQLGSVVTASLDADLEAHVALQLQGRIPLDIFDPVGAGLVADLIAQASASIAVALRLSLSGTVFHQLLEDALPEPWGDFLALVVDEFQPSVGIWAHASVSAQIKAQAVLAASLLPSSDPNATSGFTCVLGGEAGFGAGMGLSFVANLGIPTPERLVARLAEKVGALVAQQIEAGAPTAPGIGRDAVLEAAALVRMLIPLGLSGAFNIAVALTDKNDRRARSAGVIVGEIVHQGQQLLLNAACEFATRELGLCFDPFTLIEQIIEHPEVALDGVTDLIAKVAALDGVDISSADTFLDLVLDMLEAAGALVALPILPDDVRQRVGRALAVLWSAAELLHVVIAEFATPVDATDAFKSALHPLPSGAVFAAEIPHTGSAPTTVDLVLFLADTIGVDQLVAGVPWLAHIVTTLEKILSSQAGHIIPTLFVDLMPPPQNVWDRILTDLAPALGEITDKVRSAGLDPLVAKLPDGELKLFFTDVVDPVLDALPVVGLTAVAGAHDQVAATRSREALSAVLLNSVSTFVLHSIETLLDHALNGQRDALLALAQSVHDEGASSAAYVALAHLPIGDIFTVSEAEQFFRLAAQVLGDCDDALHGVTGALDRASTLGVGDRAARVAALRQIATTDDPPAGADITTTVQDIAATGSELAGRIVPPVEQFLGQWLTRAIGDFAEEFGVAVTATVKAIIDAAENLVSDLDKKIKEFEDEIAAALGDIAALLGDLAHQLRLAVDRAIRQVRARGDELIDIVVPDVLGLRAAAKDLFHQLLAAAQAIVDGLLELAEAAAGAVSDALRAAAASGQVSEQAVHNHVRATIGARSASSYHFDLQFWPTTYPISLGGQDIAAASWNSVQSTPAYASAVTNGCAAASRAAAATANKANAVAVKAQQTSSDSVVDTARRMLPKRPLALIIESPYPGEARPGRARLTIRLVGANRTFVEPTLGANPRVVIRLNSVALGYAGDWWRSDGDDLVFLAQVRPAAPAPVPAALAARPVAGRRLIAEASVGPLIAKQGTGRGWEDTGVQDPPPRIDQTTPVPSSPVGSPPTGSTGSTGSSGQKSTVLMIPTVDQLPLLEGRAGLNTLQVAVVDGDGRTATASTTFSLLPPDHRLHEQIRSAAYLRWVGERRPPAHEHDDWFAAQQELLRPAIQARAYALGGRRRFAGSRALQDWLEAEQDLILTIEDAR